MDYHAQTGTLRILDYKTADKGERPDKTHRKGNEWIDLQLPMYRHLWPALKLETAAVRKVELGYFNLPKDLDETDVALGDDWDDIILQDADATAVDVICRLRQGVFGPAVYPAPEFSDDFAAICLDNVLGGPRLNDEAEGGAA